MKTLLSLFVLIILNFQIYSQNTEDRIKFVDNNELFEFSSDSSLIHNKVVFNFNTEHSYPVICDATGNYLFNIASNQIWKKYYINEQKLVQFDLMINGNIYNDYVFNLGLNNTIVLPQPQTTCKYYVFQIDASNYHTIDQSIQGFEYQVIDMKGDNGKGEVIQKNMHLNDSSCSAIATIPSKDKKSYWVISIDYPSRDLLVHQLNKSGVKKINANTFSDPDLFDFINYGYSQANADNPFKYGLPFVELKVNQQNNLIAIVGVDRKNGNNNVIVKVFDFDNETGNISFKYQLINSNKKGHHILCFTPDSKYLFFGQSIFDLSLNSSEEIQNSEFVHDLNLEAITTDPINRVIAINHHRFYVFDYDGNELKKELITDELTYSGSIGEHNGFSIFPSIYLNNLEKVVTITKDGKNKYCSGETVFITTFYEPEFEEVTHYWYDKDSNIVGIKDLIIEDVKKEHGGWYYYEISAECGENKKRDSVYIEVQELEPKITASQNNFCYGDSTTLSLEKDYDSIIWNTGESTKDIIVKESGVYSATVTQGECINDTNIVINVNPLPTLDIDAPNGTILCDGGSIILEAKVPPNTNIVWNDGTRLAKRTFSKSGTYTLTAEDIKTGCKNSKSIVVSDIENLKAEIQGDPTFCDGESTTLTIQPQGKSYLWNDGETTQSIVVNQSGVYSATITTDTDCKIDAEIEVIKNPLPTFQILGETIICNNSTTIYPDKDYNFYEWSNGKSSKSITIDKAGNYNLTVTDENGCKATQNITITESTPEINLSNRNINFGELLFGNTKSENITTDRDILIIKNSNVFDVNYQNSNIIIYFNPKDIGEFIDTLIIESVGDCKATDTIYIKGICKAEILAKVSNSEGYPGDIVNNTVNLELLQNITLPKDFNYEIDIQINQDAISIIDATTFNYTNNKLEINIADYLNKTQYDEKIKDINSKIMLAKNLENELNITRFETDNQYLIPIRQNGNIKIYEVCLYEARLIENYNEALIGNITKTKINLTTYYAGKYEIIISDISGKTIYQKAETTSDDEEINFNYNLTNGTYIIKIQEPGKIQTRKIVFVE